MSSEITKRKKEDEAATVERTRGGTTYNPRIDIWEGKSELVLHADLPGVAPDDLNVHFEDKELTIHGKVSPRHEGVHCLYAEYGIGDFHRTFRVGESIDAAKISAELQNGVLTLHLPKTEEVKPRKIEIKAS